MSGNEQLRMSVLLRMNLISNNNLQQNPFFLPCWNRQTDRYSWQHVCTQMEKGS